MPQAPLPEPESRARRIASSVEGGAATGFLVSTLLGLNAVQGAGLAVRPLSKPAFRRFNGLLARTWWGLLVDSTRALYGTGLVLSGDDVPQDENAVVIANHQSMTDVPCLLAFAKTKGRLGDLKWFAKKSVKYIPGVGWGLWFMGSPFLDRDWSRDQRSIERTFARIVGEKLPVWMISFPEGTRQTAAKREAAQRYAREHGLAPFEHLLVPRTKGFAATVHGLRHHVQAVYDLTLAYEGGVPTLWQFMKGYSRRIHLHVRRHPIETLPLEDDALAGWLMDRFREKDALLDGFYRTGRLAPG